MDPHFGQWLNLAVRWLHFTTGVAWIGTSFYFNWLDSRLAAPETPKKGVAGELWAVHAGGFYQVRKFKVAPERLPGTLHWFKWEAYFTWLSGISLLAIVYYFGVGAVLLPPESPLSMPVAIGLSVVALGVTWHVYDALCKSRFGNSDPQLGVVCFLLVVGLAFGFTRVFTDRAAFVHVGAVLGTLMAANVFAVIIPSQRQLVSATAEGREPDATLGAKAKQRSLHNNYMTLPVLFIMMSSHFPMTYGQRYNWLVLTGLALVGASVRHYFNLRNKGQNRVWIMPAAAVAMVGLAVATRPPSRQLGSNSGGTVGAEVSFTTVRGIIRDRCESCHSVTPTNSAYVVAPLGVRFDSPDEIKALADRINSVAVLSETMPLGNLTGMTPAERGLLGRWIVQGARIR